MPATSGCFRLEAASVADRVVAAFVEGRGAFRGIDDRIFAGCKYKGYLFSFFLYSLNPLKCQFNIDMTCLSLRSSNSTSCMCCRDSCCRPYSREGSFLSERFLWHWLDHRLWLLRHLHVIQFPQFHTSPVIMIDL